jgi:hypothetical protein
MALGGWLTVAGSLLLIAMLCRRPKISFGNILGYVLRFSEDGKLTPRTELVPQVRKERLLRFVLWAIAVGDIVVVVWKTLGR